MHAFLYASAGAAALMIAAASPAQTVRTTLPIPPAPFSGVIAPDVAHSRPMPVQPVRAPAGAPNVLLFMSDDVGFAMSSAFGGPVPTPNFERLAAMGQRYNRFHTTGICSPSRAALGSAGPRATSCRRGHVPGQRRRCAAARRPPVPRRAWRAGSPGGPAPVPVVACRAPATAAARGHRLTGVQANAYAVAHRPRCVAIARARSAAGTGPATRGVAARCRRHRRCR